MTFAEVLPKIIAGGKFFRDAWFQIVPAKTPGDQPTKILRFYVTSYVISADQTILIRVSAAAGQVASFTPQGANMNDKAGDLLANDWNELK